MAAVVLAVDVPVTVQLDQQSMFENPEVPQFLFIDRVPDIPAATQRQVRAVQNCAEDPRFARCSSWGGVDVSVLMQRQVLGVGQCRKLWRFRSCSRCSSWNVVDMPVRVQRQVCSDSAENRAGAAGAVHRCGVEPL